MTTDRDHRTDAVCGTGIHIVFTEIAGIGQQRVHGTGFSRQVADLARHGLELLLLVWRLHHVGSNDQQAASRHRRLSSPAGPVRQPPQPQNAPDAARAATRPPKAEQKPGVAVNRSEVAHPTTLTNHTEPR